MNIATPELLVALWARAWGFGGGGWVYAQTDGAGLSIDILSGLKDSVAGACLIMVVIGWLAPKSLVDRLDAMLARVEKQRDELAKQQGEVIPVLVMVQQQMLPALKDSTEALKLQTSEIATARAEITRLREEVARLMYQLDTRPHGPDNRRRDG